MTNNFTSESFVDAQRQNVLIIVIAPKTGQGRKRQKSASMLILRHF
jgi:hypothetical protein